MPATITDAEKILVRVPNWVGDAVMSLPALRKLREKFPAADITVLARPSVAGLYASVAGVNRVLVFDHRGRHRGLAGLERLAAELRRERFDLAVLFQNAFQAAWLAFRAGIPRRVGYARDARRLLLTEAIAVPKPADIPPHETYYYLELLRRAGWLGSLPVIGEIRLEPSAAAGERLRQRLRALGLGEGSDLRVVIAPGAAYGSAKCWLPERFAALADRLAEAYDAAVLLCGTSAEASLGEAIAARMRTKPISLVGQTTLEEFLALLASVDLFIGNDSGAMHLAAGVGLPQVIIFGPSDEAGTGPLNARARVVKHPVSCSPCFLRQCPVDHRCMTRVGVEDVWQAVDAALADRRVVERR
ncbi:MAG: lipopolysaccharide heptosyltransferase II [Acidobacteria bacterium]|nr:lipopolysaccharide heptosyltransferase II [Acidobacteriota bacterium]